MRGGWADSASHLRRLSHPCGKETRIGTATRAPPSKRRDQNQEDATTVDEHVVGTGGANPVACTPAHACGAYDSAHRHQLGCGHDTVPHADHVDYVVAGHLHHPDEHGAVKVG